jgi:hypothetical protein
MRLKPVEATSIKGNGIFEKFQATPSPAMQVPFACQRLCFLVNDSNDILATATKFIEKIDLRIKSSHPYAQVSEI